MLCGDNKGDITLVGTFVFKRQTLQKLPVQTCLIVFLLTYNLNVKFSIKTTSLLGNQHVKGSAFGPLIFSVYVPTAYVGQHKNKYKYVNANDE